MNNFYLILISIISSIFLFFLSYYIFYFSFLLLPIIFAIFFGKNIDDKKEIFKYFLFFSFLTCFFASAFAIFLDYYILESLKI